MNYSYEDIGKQFISHLQGALSRRGFTISDRTMLPVGQDTRLQLLKAIEESEIYVVVFSNNYASSVRSLDELVDIMECLGRFDQRKVLPVFYNVEPSDVRSQEGSFKEAFQAHKADEDIDSDRVQKWKQALRDAGQLSGLTMQNGDEGKFVSDIVEQLEKMQNPQELHVADHPVVLGSRVKELISTLRLDCEVVLVVAVFGISGIGIHYRGGSNWKIELQNMLISCLSQNCKFPSMDHHNEGVTKIKKLIRGRKILLVLDDVDNFEQLKSLGINPAWSLDELVHIMDCLGKLDQRKVLPVFYKVEPSDVRSQDGSFKDAFQAHEANDNIDPKRVQKWKQALRDAGLLSGLTLQNGDEGKFVSDIVEQLEKMQSPQELHVADHPVVVGSRVKELISTLRLDCQDVLVVAVFGISGIGKTTIVRATYNKISSYFDVSCFLGGIHYRGGSNWKIELQNLLISCLSQNCKFPSMDHHNEGVTKIKKLIRGRKILLVLDDVDNFEQLKSLGINPAWFYKGSRIIVITRDKQSLGIIPYTSYQTTELNRRESLNLFNQLMFSRDNNLVNMKFIEEVAALSGGLPLVLEVWSRYFIGHERKQWPSLLKKLKRIPHGDVQKQLQMSYDSLSATAKNLFLDIACFFDGMDKELVFKVLHDEESAFFPDIEIQHLVDKFLVKDSDEDGFIMVVMNQVIREMGQEVIRQENVDEPGKRTRLISDWDILRLFRDCSGTDSVRSIKLESSDIEEPVTVQIEAFKKMSNLRFIQLRRKLRWSFSSKDVIDKARSCFSFKHLKYLVRKRNKAPCKSMSACLSFKHLKYLEWEGFPCKSLDNIDMGNVVVIALWHSKLEKLWEGVKRVVGTDSVRSIKLESSDIEEPVTVQIEAFKKMSNLSFKKLKILDVSESTSLAKTGNFIGLENLEELNLTKCFKLEGLDSSIGCLQKLVELDLSCCTGLKRLPWEMICKLTSLQKLNLLNCFNLMEISHEIGSLISLKHLDLGGYTRSKNLPNSLCQLHQLTSLYLSYCHNLKSIPDLPLNIQYFYAEGCPNLVNLPSNISELQFLMHIRLDNCSKLGSEGFTQVTTLRNLKTLDMSNCNISQVSSGIGNLVSLEHLYLSRNTFSSLPESFSNLSKLKELFIDDCSELQLLPPLPSQLTDIDATKCISLDVMSFNSMQKAFFKVFKESLMNTEGFFFRLSGEELPEWCTYRNSGNVLSFVAPIRFDSKICGILSCATTDYWPTFLTIHNKTKEKSHRMATRDRVFTIPEVEFSTLKVVFCPLNNKTVVVEAGDTVELWFDRATSCGLRLVYEDDLVDSGLVLPS
ncbi:TMV resistance protein N [Artemisia annua]|uniref:TMV resistance protein N n=1 Tax=Artemisia annua TaxID=35608 RepID=A0A2U1P2X2_ARTAN|nr:TMV resistance protein N [Artemisia annua]